MRIVRGFRIRKTWIWLMAALLILLLSSMFFLQQIRAQQTGSIVYVAPTGNGMQGVFVANPNGQEAYQVQVPLLTVSQELGASPDGNWIGATGQTLQDEGNSAYNIYVFSPTGADFSPITSYGYAAIPEAFAFSPDSQNIAFDAVAGGVSLSIMVRPVQSSVQVTALGSASFENFVGWGLTWTPDGQNIVAPMNTMATDSGGYLTEETCLYLMPAVTNGVNQKVELTYPLQPLGSVLPTDDFNQVLPTFSPDGTTIAFVVWDIDEAAQLTNAQAIGLGGIKSSSIYLANADGGNPTEIVTIPGAVITSLSWIHDPVSTGTLLFSEEAQSALSPMGIWEINTDGSGLQEVLSNSAAGVWGSSISPSLPPSPSSSPSPLASSSPSPSPTQIISPSPTQTSDLSPLQSTPSPTSAPTGTPTPFSSTVPASSAQTTISSSPNPTISPSQTQTQPGSPQEAIYEIVAAVAIAAIVIVGVVVLSRKKKQATTV